MNDNLKTPVFTLVKIQTSDGEKKTFKNRIGIAYRKDDGEILVKLNALPLNGTLLIGEFESGDGAEYQDEQERSENS